MESYYEQAVNIENLRPVFYRLLFTVYQYFNEIYYNYIHLK